MKLKEIHSDIMRFISKTSPIYVGDGSPLGSGECEFSGDEEITNKYEVNEDESYYKIYATTEVWEQSCELEITVYEDTIVGMYGLLLTKQN